MTQPTAPIHLSVSEIRQRSDLYAEKNKKKLKKITDDQRISFMKLTVGGVGGGGGGG